MKRKIKKAAFIRKYPDAAPADIVKLAAAKGIKLTSQYISQVRMLDKPGREKKIKTASTYGTHGVLKGKQKSGHYGGLASAKAKKSKEDFSSSIASASALFVREAVIAFIDEKIKTTEDLLSQLRKTRKMFG